MKDLWDKALKKAEQEPRDMKRSAAIGFYFCLFILCIGVLIGLFLGRL